MKPHLNITMAIESTADDLQKSEVILNAQLYAVIGNKIKSRQNARNH